MYYLGISNGRIENLTLVGDSISYVLLVEGANACTINGVVIDGARYSNYSAFVSGSENVRFNNCIFKNAINSGVYVQNSRFIEFNNCVFEDNFQGVVVSGSSDVVFQNCVFRSSVPNKHQILVLGNSSNIKIVNCKVSDCGVGYSGPVLGTYGNGIFLSFCDGVIVSNCVSENNLWSGILIGQGSKNVVCSGNVFKYGIHPDASTAAWIEMPGCESITFTDNRLYGGLSVGDSGGNKLIIKGNWIEAKNRGIDVGSGCTDALISSNIIIGKGMDIGIYLWEKRDARVVVSDNYVSNFKFGIFVNNVGATGQVKGLGIVGNTIGSCQFDFAKGWDIDFFDCYIGLNSFKKVWRYANDTTYEQVDIEVLNLMELADAVSLLESLIKEIVISSSEVSSVSEVLIIK